MVAFMNDLTKPYRDARMMIYRDGRGLWVLVKHRGWWVKLRSIADPRLARVIHWQQLRDMERLPT